MTVGERVKQRRIELGLSQEEVAEKVGYKSRSSINKIELARNIPTDKIKVMAKALDTTPEQLIGWENAGSTFDRVIMTYMEKLSNMDRADQEIIFNLIDRLNKQ